MTGSFELFVVVQTSVNRGQRVKRVYVIVGGQVAPIAVTILTSATSANGANAIVS